ncbi:Uncharacterised protein [Vibrio cholerae]|nr:Uncharacterised protein [Vibrio cholerae]
MCQVRVLFGQMQAISKGSEVAQCLNKCHTTIMFIRINLAQACAPNSKLLQEPLVVFIASTITVNNHLLRQAWNVWTKHRVQPNHWTFVHL